MLKLENLHLQPGRLLVIPQQKDRYDSIAVVQESNRSVSTAEVAAAAPDVQAKPGDIIVYDRLHSTEIELLDRDGKRQMYRFVLARDLAAVAPAEKSNVRLGIRDHKDYDGVDIALKKLHGYDTGQ